MDISFGRIFFGYNASEVDAYVRHLQTSYETRVKELDEKIQEITYKWYADLDKNEKEEYQKDKIIAENKTIIQDLNKDLDAALFKNFPDDIPDRAKLIARRSVTVNKKILDSANELTEVITLEAKEQLDLAKSIKDEAEAEAKVIKDEAATYASALVAESKDEAEAIINDAEATKSTILAEAENSKKLTDELNESNVKNTEAKVESLRNKAMAEYNAKIKAADNYVKNAQAIVDGVKKNLGSVANVASGLNSELIVPEFNNVPQAEDKVDNNDSEGDLVLRSPSNRKTIKE